jgi:hypothetical protein
MLGGRMGDASSSSALFVLPIRMRPVLHSKSFPHVGQQVILLWKEFLSF